MRVISNPAPIKIAFNEFSICFLPSYNNNPLTKRHDSKPLNDAGDCVKTLVMKMPGRGLSNIK